VTTGGPHPAPGLPAPFRGHGVLPPGPLLEMREADIRQQGVERLRHLNLQHARYAWDQRHQAPVAPYALAVLFAQPAGQPTWQTLTAATRLWTAGPATSDLPRLLRDLDEAVTRPGEAVDVRARLADGVDGAMADDAWYVGVAVSSLDTSTGTWEEACRTASGAPEVPGSVRIVLVDGTLVVLERRGSAERGALTVRSTRPLGVPTLEPPYRWSLVDAVDLRCDPVHGVILRRMEVLGLSLWRADNAHLLARARAAGATGRA